MLKSSLVNIDKSLLSQKGTIPKKYMAISIKLKA